MNLFFSYYSFIEYLPSLKIFVLHFQLTFKFSGCSLFYFKQIIYILSLCNFGIHVSLHNLYTCGSLLYNMNQSK